MGGGVNLWGVKRLGLVFPSLSLVMGGQVGGVVYQKS